jgi:hypothetical protein
MACTLLLFSDALACCGVAVALSEVAVSVLPPGFQAFSRAAVIIVVALTHHVIGG